MAGISFEGEELWTDASQLPSDNAYRRADTEALSLELPQDFAHSVVDYFHDFYADPPRFYRVSAVLNDRDRRSNCYRFGATVLSKCPQEFFEAYGITAEIAKAGNRQPSSMTLGSLAVLGTPGKPLGFNHTRALHAMVSLGDTLPNQHLHTIALGGNLAISPLEPSLKGYSVLPDVYTEDSPANLRSNPQIIDEVKRAWSGSK